MVQLTHVHTIVPDLIFLGSATQALLADVAAAGGAEKKVLNRRHRPEGLKHLAAVVG